MARCIAAGTLIRTPSGEVPVEEVGDRTEIVTLRDGLETVESIKWIGQRYVDIKRHARPEQVAPVRIRAGAIAEGQPSRDLLVSPEHAVLINGVLIQARALVNGGSIVQERGTDEVTYYHLELQSHGVFFADGLTVESYLDNGDRSFFETEGQPVMLHPVLTPATEFDVRKSAEAYAPFLTDPATVEPTWRQLAQRSEAMGYGQPKLITTADSDLHIVADGKTIRPTVDGDGRFVFVLPAGVASASLVSRFAIPTDVVPYADDARRLGVAVSSISIRSQGNDVLIPADFPIDASGWHDAEQLDTSSWRWTDGAAQLPLSDVQGASVVTVTCRTVAGYPIYDERVRPVQQAA